VSITGTYADQFSVQQQPTSPISQEQSTSFIIRFHPTSAGAKTAAISIVNDDSDENPYDITLLGNGEPIGGLIAYYPLNGNANDESGNGHNGTIHGNPSYSEDRFGNANGAMNFNGVDTYVELPDESSFDLTEMTIVAIAKVPDYSRRNNVIAKGLNFGNYTIMLHGPGDWNPGSVSYAHVAQGGGNWSAGVYDSPVLVNSYFHAAVTLDTAYFRSYFNGQPQVIFPAPTPPVLNNENVTIGLAQHQGLPLQFFFGVIDEIRIYNHALSASEIQALYNANLAGDQIFGVLSTDNGSSCDLGCNFFNWDTSGGFYDTLPRAATVSSDIEYCDCRFSSFAFITDFGPDSLTIRYENGPGPNSVTSLRFHFTNVSFGRGIYKVAIVDSTFPEPGPSPAPAYPPIITWGDDWIEVRISHFGGSDGIPPNAVYNLKLQLISK
jgi:hypothetical protein